MSSHLGKREREARKRRMRARKSVMTQMDGSGVVTLKLGRAKWKGIWKYNAAALKKKFAGCVVDAEK